MLPGQGAPRIASGAFPIEAQAAIRHVVPRTAPGEWRQCRATSSPAMRLRSPARRSRRHGSFPRRTPRTRESGLRLQPGCRSGRSSLRPSPPAPLGTARNLSQLDAPSGSSRYQTPLSVSGSLCKALTPSCSVSTPARAPPGTSRRVDSRHPVGGATSTSNSNSNRHRDVPPFISCIPYVVSAEAIKTRSKLTWPLTKMAAIFTAVTRK